MIWCVEFSRVVFRSARGDIGGGNLSVAGDVLGAGHVEGDVGQGHVGIGDRVVNYIVGGVDPAAVSRSGQRRAGIVRHGRRDGRVHRLREGDGDGPRQCGVGVGDMRVVESDRFFFNDTAATVIYTLSLHDALPIFAGDVLGAGHVEGDVGQGHVGIGDRVVN